MRIALQNFTGGEISPTLSARYDLSRYRNCVACMENMLPGLHGDVARRPGTRFLAELDASAVLLPFSFSSLPSQNFILVLGEKCLGQHHPRVQAGFVGKTGRIALHEVD